jgi:nickel-dependent lactate racemase
MLLTLKYGKGELSLEIPEARLSGVLLPVAAEPAGPGEEIVRGALENPVSSKRLVEIVSPGDSVAIVTSDITRPCPSRVMLPPVLEELSAAGIARDRVTIVFALGSHRKHSKAEMIQLVGEEIFRSYRCIDHDPGDCVTLGTTRRGTPVQIFRPVAEADRRICLGNIEYHYFAGYSGGAKAIFPGVSTQEAIQANHSMMLREEARAGKLEGNPVREDLEEVLGVLGVDFILNVVLDPGKNILKAVAGHPLDAHREGCRFLDSHYRVPLEAPADIVLVSAGGYPKDINVYQAQKALDNAMHAVRPGGIVVWVASCREGLGSAVFEKWIMEAACPQDLLDRVKTHFELGGHKAAAIAMALRKASIFLVSDLDASLAKRFFAEPFDSLEAAIGEAFRRLGGQSTVLVIPYGSSTLPSPRGR